MTVGNAILRARRVRALAGAACVIVCGCLPSAARAAVPRGFVGMNVDGPAMATPAVLRQSLDAMVRSGVQSIRVVFDWSSAQPYPSWNVVPIGQVGEFAPDPVPTSFAATDEIVRLAAERRLTVLPTVLYAPEWDARPHSAATLAIPADPQAYANYLRLLVARYGTRGTFWRANPHLPRRPIRAWQVWNEPNLLNDWPAPLVPDFVNLLRAAHRAIKQTDPRAKVVLAGMPNYVWRDLATLYRAGARRYFDVVAVHPYTRTVRGVITILQLVRQTMDRHGDGRKPMLLTEINWPAAVGHTPFHADFETTPATQARNLGALMPLLARNRRALRLAGFYYYTWMTTYAPGGDPFQFAGLFDDAGGRPRPVPAYAVFRRAALALEGCRRAGATARRCR